MGLFDLPPENNRVVRDPWFQQLNAVKPQYRQDTGYYIIYRSGHDLRYITWFFGIAVFLLSCLHSYWGIMPLLSNYPLQKDFLGFYLHYINFSGPILFFSLLYYFVWLKKNVLFSQYNILQYSPRKTLKDFETYQLVLLPAMFLMSGAVVFRPSIIASFFYLDIFHGLFNPLFDTTLFVACVCIIIIYLHTLFAQLFMLFGIITFYLYYEHKTQKQGSKQ